MCEQGGEMKINGVVVRSKIVFVEVGARLQTEHYLSEGQVKNFPR